MDEIKLALDENQTGRFYILNQGEEIARLEIKITENVLQAMHTEVNPGYEGKGLAHKLFLEMVRYARNKQLKIKAYCHYVQAQFKKRMEMYADVIN